MSNEQRIRELAHQIWESEGKPDGEAARHWQMAIQLLDREEAVVQPLSTKKSTPRKPRSKAATAPRNDETLLEKPALLGKPAGARKPAKAKRQTVARTTKISEPAPSDTNPPRE